MAGKRGSGLPPVDQWQRAETFAAKVNARFLAEEHFGCAGQHRAGTGSAPGQHRVGTGPALAERTTRSLPHAASSLARVNAALRPSGTPRGSWAAPACSGTVQQRVFVCEPRHGRSHVMGGHADPCHPSQRPGSGTRLTYQHPHACRALAGGRRSKAGRPSAAPSSAARGGRGGRLNGRGGCGGGPDRGREAECDGDERAERDLNKVYSHNLSRLSEVGKSVLTAIKAS